MLFGGQRVVNQGDDRAVLQLQQQKVSGCKLQSASWLPQFPLPPNRVGSICGFITNSTLAHAQPNPRSFRWTATLSHRHWPRPRTEPGTPLRSHLSHQATRFLPLTSRRPTTRIGAICCSFHPLWQFRGPSDKLEHDALRILPPLPKYTKKNVSYVYLWSLQRILYGIIIQYI